MADQKISELTQLVAANIAATDELAIVDSSVPRTKKVTASDLADYVVEQGLFGPDILSTVGDGTTGTYALGWTPTSESTISVFVDGVLQDYVTDAAYAVAGSNIVLAENLPDGSLLTVFRREVASTQPAFATNVKFVQEYKTVAALQGSNEAYAVLPVGEYVRVLDGNFVYKILNSASTGDVANSAATPVQFEVVPGVAGVHADAWGCDPTGSTACTDEFNKAAQFAVANNVRLNSAGTYLMDKTLNPGGRLVWDAHNTVLNWTGASTSNMTEANENPSGTSTQQGSGKYAGINTDGMEGSVIDGFLTVRGSNPGGMTLAARATIPGNIVGITACTSTSANIRWGSLFIAGWDHPLWLGDQRGAGAQMLPYTRWSIDYLYLQFNANLPFAGQSGNAFDDMFITELRCARNGGQFLVRGTELAGGVAFLNGLNQTNDVEPQTLTYTSASTTATLSADNTDMPASGVIVFEDGADNKNGGPIWHVTAYTKSGTTLTLETAPDNSGSGKAFAVDPPSYKLSTGHWEFAQTYIEELHDTFWVSNSSSLTGNIKVSGGTVSGRYGAPILAAPQGGFGCDINIVAHRTSLDNANVRRLVAVGTQRDGTDYNSVRVEIRLPGESDQRTYSEPVEVVTLESDHLVNTAEPAYYNYKHQLIAHFSDKTISVAPVLDDGEVGTDEYSTGRLGAAELVELANINTPATRSGNFAAVSGGTSVKSSGGSGRLIHNVSMTTGKRYRVSIKLDSYTAGAPKLRQTNGASSDIDTSGFIFARAGGRYEVYFTALPGIGGVEIQGFTNGDYTVSEFTLSEVLSV